MMARPFRYEWDGTVRRLKLVKSVKLVASYLSQYANNDGVHIRPGIERLALETGYNEKTIRRALAALVEIGLIVRVRSGSKFGRAGKADEYRLAIPDDLLERAELVTVVNVGPPSGGQEHRTLDVQCSDGSVDISDPNTGHQMSTYQPVTTPASSNTPNIWSLPADPLTPREADQPKSAPNSHLSLVVDNTRKGTGFCQPCYEKGLFVLAADPANGWACVMHLRQEAS